MIRFCVIMVILLVAGSCSNGPQNRSTGLASQLRKISHDFFAKLSQEGGVEAQSYFTLFIPDNNVHRRHIQKFREALETSLRQASQKHSSLQFNSSANRIFFLSEYQPKGWEVPPKVDRPANILDREFKNGTRLGWTALHAYWSQANRLLIGGADWINSLPSSIRADLANPLSYVLRASVFLEESPSLTQHKHSVTYDFVEVGKERVVFSQSYPVVLSYPLQ